MEIMVLVIFESLRPDPSQAWAERQRRKLKSGVAEVARLIGNRIPGVMQPITYGDIAAGVMLSMFDFMFAQGNAYGPLRTPVA